MDVLHRVPGPMEHLCPAAWWIAQRADDAVATFFPLPASPLLQGLRDNAWMTSLFRTIPFGVGPEESRSDQDQCFFIELKVMTIVGRPARNTWRVIIRCEKVI